MMRTGSEVEQRLAKARRTAWWLAGLAAFIFVGYLAWMYLRSQGAV